MREDFPQQTNVRRKPFTYAQQKSVINSKLLNASLSINHPKFQIENNIVLIIMENLIKILYHELFHYQDISWFLML